jgi:hypothetical protein
MPIFQTRDSLAQAAIPAGAGARAEALCAEIGRVRSRRVLMMLTFLWTVNLLDLILTLVALRLGNFQELNPLADALIHSPPLLTLFKISLVSFATGVFFLFRRRRVTEMACYGLSGVHTGLLFIWLLYFLPV